MKCFLKTVPGKEKQKHRATGQDRKPKDKPHYFKVRKKQGKILKIYDLPSKVPNKAASEPGMSIDKK